MRMVRRACIVAWALVLLAAPPAPAKTVRGGTVEVGKGVAPIFLGMSRDRVKDILGKPRERNRFYSAYGPASSAEVSFDVYFDNSANTRMLGFWGRKFVLPDGTEIFRRGAVGKLKKIYGSRLVKKYNRRIDLRYYRVKSRYRGRRVWTDFNVARHASDARVLSAFILFPYWR